MEKLFTREKISKLLEIIYFLTLAVFIAWSFLNTTKMEITWPEYFYTDIKAVLLVIIFLKAGYAGNYTIRDLVLISILGIGFMFNVGRNGYEELEILFLLVVGAKGISLKKIIKIYLLTVGCFLLFTVLSALLGYTENLVYIQEGRRKRMALGIGYPTDFSAYIFYGILCYLYLRGKAIRYVELASIALAGVAVYWVTDARLNTICILMTAGIFMYHKIRTALAERKQKVYNMNPCFSLLLALASVLCAGFMIVMSTLYGTGNRLALFLDRVLNYRLYQGNKAIDIFGFSMWGRSIPMQGYGGTTELPKHYFFLDSSYLNILMTYGLFTLSIVLLVWICISFRARSEKDWVLLWIVAILSVQCMVEHHMLEPAYNPFFWGLLADTVTQTRKSKGFIWNRKKSREVAHDQ